MFNLFRSREKSVQILLGVLLGLVALSMLVYLIPGGFGGPSASGENVIATVGDEQITTVDVQRALQRVTQNQPNLPKGVLAMYVPSIVSQLVDEKAMAYQARRMGLRVSDEDLSNAIQADFSAGLGGKFDMNMYQAILQEQGMTVPDYEKQRREAMLAMRLEALESQSIVITDQEARAEYQRRNLKVGLDYLAFTAKDFESKVNKDPSAVKAYFDKNRALFRAPEKRNLVLVVGTTADFLQTVHVSDDQLRRDYQDSIDSYRTPERVRARHILIKTQGKPKEEAQKLKAKAEDILKQLQHGGDFADLAKKNSDDPGSAAKGGELGWIVRGQTVPNFEKTLFSLQPSQLSGVVETEYGYHIIQAEEKQNARTQSFEEVKPQLLAEAQKQAAGDSLNRGVTDARAEIAKNPSQADAIAQKYHLRIFKVDNFASGGTLPEVNNQSEIVNSIFSTPKGGVTDVANLENQGKAAFAVVTNVTPAHNAEYADVQNNVTQKYVNAESERLAQEAAKAAADRATKGEPLEALAKSYGVQVKTAAPFTIEGAAEGIGAASLLQAAFKANVGAIVGPIAGTGGQFVCKVSQKIPADMSQFAKNKDGIVQALQQQRQGIDGPLFRDSIVTELRRKGKVRTNEQNLNRMIGSYQS
ncbi:MAG: peptidylprolyl isomerase [Acidobacteriaceae bacterium]|nr:peptidylprolyl isomerase [Acidobacteriaceae bacterium]